MPNDAINDYIDITNFSNIVEDVVDEVQKVDDLVKDFVDALPASFKLSDSEVGDLNLAIGHALNALKEIRKVRGAIDRINASFHNRTEPKTTEAV